MQVFLDQNYVRVVDGVLDPKFCDHLIAVFESQQQWHRERPGNFARLIELDMRSSENRLGREFRKRPWLGARGDYNWDQDNHVIMDRVLAQAADYKQRWDPLNMMPQDFASEGLRMKCYRPNGYHEFKTHVDQANRGSATRFLAFLFYLNDSDAGTEFFNPEVTVAARQGRLVMFPPTWQYPHRGLMPTDGHSKYIMSTYLHYAH